MTDPEDPIIKERYPSYYYAMHIYSTVQRRRGKQPFKKITRVVVDPRQKNAHLFEAYKTKSGRPVDVLSLGTPAGTEKGLFPPEHISTQIAHEEAHSLQPKKLRHQAQEEAIKKGLHSKTQSSEGLHEYYDIPAEKQAMEETRAYRKSLKSIKKQFRKEKSLEKNPSYQSEQILSSLYD